MGGKDKAKGGGKSSKKGDKKADTNKLTPVDRTFYELTIADLNQKLARLRTHFQALDETNTNLNEKLYELEEDRVDISAHLERKLAESQDTISELQERLIEITKVRDKENAESKEKIRELEQRFKAMNDQLNSEIKLLNGKLNSLDEFRVQRDVLLAKFDDQESELKEKDRAHKETLYNLEQKAIVERNELKMEVEQKLLQVAEDFMRTSEIRKAGYTHRLIRENVALQKELDTIMRDYFDMKRKYDQNEKRCRSIVANETANETIKEQLVHVGKQRLEIIEQLTKRYEQLQTEVEILKDYREKYERLIKRDTCERFREIDAAAQKRSLKQHIEHLENERETLHSLALRQAKEIKRMREIMEHIKDTVEMAIGTVGATQQMMKPDEKLRKNLIGALIEIISRSVTGKLIELSDYKLNPDFQSQLATIYEPGQLGLMSLSSGRRSVSRRRTSKTLVELFKREARLLRNTALCKSGSLQAQLLRDHKIIPSAHDHDPKSLLDVDYGTLLYFSLSHDEDADNDAADAIIDLPSNIETAAGSGITQKAENAHRTFEIDEKGDFDINLFY